jgi:hypothetical protein
MLSESLSSLAIGLRQVGEEGHGSYGFREDRNGPEEWHGPESMATRTEDRVCGAKIDLERCECVLRKIRPCVQMRYREVRPPVVPDVYEDVVVAFGAWKIRRALVMSGNV